MLRHGSGSISVWYVFYRKFMVFLRTGRTLHIFFIASLVLFLLFLNLSLNSENGQFTFHSFFTMYFFSLCITTELDAYSRYQNYKIVKDLIHTNGFRILIIKPFSKSSCQRDAATEAARQLELGSEVKGYFYQMGYRWYHLIPSLLIENPKLFFTKGYWSSTFFVPRYKSKFFLWWNESWFIGVISLPGGQAGIGWKNEYWA